jgi:lysophospholipase L1-like esterase
MVRKLLVSFASFGLFLALALFLFPRLREAEAKESVELVNNVEAISRLLDERAAASTEPLPVFDSAYPPRLYRDHLSEEVAPLFFPSLKKDNWVYDPWLYARHAGGAEFRRRFPEHPDGAFEVRFNAQGMREDADVRQDRPELRILVAGDSHVEGVCTNAESFINVLEDRLSAEGRDVEALNAGAGGYHTYSYLATLECYRDLFPDVFVVTVYGGNDLWGAINLQRYFERRPSPKKEPYSLKEMLDKGPAFHAPIAQELSQIANFLNNPEMEEVAIDLHASIALEIEELARSMGCKTLFVYLPPPLVTQPEHFPEVVGEMLGELDMQPADLLVTERIADGWLAFLAERGMAAVDLRTLLRSAELAYWKTDLHLNVLGHRLVAEELARHPVFANAGGAARR